MTGERYVAPVVQELDDNGVPLAGAKLYFFENETTTPKTTYADVDLTIPNPHPVEADGAGRFMADIFMQNSSYRVTLNDSDDVLVWSKDDVNNISTSLSTLPFAGMIVGFYGTQDQLDVFLANQWYVMDGNNGTQNTDELFVKSTTSIGGIGLTGGSELTIAEMPAHTHSLTERDTDSGAGADDTAGNNPSGGAVTSSTGGGAEHEHTLTMDEFDNQPAYLQWIWVIYLGV